MTGDDGVVRIASGVIAMKTIVSVLIAMSVLAGIVVPASALDAGQSPLRPTSTEQSE